MMGTAVVKQKDWDAGQKTLSNYQSGWRIVDTLFDGRGEVQLREIVMGDGHRYWNIVYVDEKGDHNRGFATRWSYAKKAFHKAGKNTWV
jgi:hypothetical protein